MRGSVNERVVCEINRTLVTNVGGLFLAGLGLLCFLEFGNGGFCGCGFKRSMGSCESRHRYTVRRTTHVIESNLATERD